MALIKGKIEGLGALKSSLNRYAKAIENNAKKELKTASNNIVSGAKSRCKAPSIASTIGVRENEGKYEIYTDGVISVYLEFGTGNFAKALLSSYPSDWQQMARKFYISGLGRMPSFPYLYPAYEENKRRLVETIKQSIESL